ncbi:MAG: AAA family ATPase [Sedimenticola sp.]
MKRDIFAHLDGWRRRKNRKPLILRGARQVGKTWSLQEFGSRNFPTTHYLNFEQDNQLESLFQRDLKPSRIIQELSFHLDRSIHPAKDLLIFDEIQECPRALTSLKYFAEELPEMAVCAAGSLLGVELADVSFPVGKVEFLDMYPMSFSEFLLAVGDDRSYGFLTELSLDSEIPEVVHNRLWEQFKNYLIVGGLPEVVKSWRENRKDPYAAFKEVRRLQHDLITAYIADMAKHCGKQNSMHLERLWRNIPAQLAKEQDGSASKYKFKGVIPGIHGYARMAGVIDWLEKAGLLIKVHIVNSGNLPFSAYSKENAFKLYYFDIGLLGAVGSLDPKTILSYDYGTYKGYFAENLVAQEFICSGHGPLYSWRERTAEVEFLREIGGQIIPVEVKSGWVTQAKSLKVFAQKYNPVYRAILSGRRFSIDHTNRIHLYPLFLAGYFPLE